MVPQSDYLFLDFCVERRIEIRGSTTRKGIQHRELVGGVASLLLFLNWNFHQCTIFYKLWGTVLWGPAVCCQDILILLTFSCWHLLLHRQEPKYEDEKEQWQLCVWLVSLHIFTFFLVSMGACCWLRKFLLPMYRTYDKLYRFPETWENKKPPDRCTAQPSHVETCICLLALRACIVSQVMWIFLVWNSQPACLHLFSTSHGSLLAASFSDLRFCSRTTSASFYHCVLTLEPCP